MVGAWRPRWFVNRVEYSAPIQRLLRLTDRRWLRRLDSNQRIAESKSAVLPLDDASILWSNTGDSNPYHRFGRPRCYR